MMKTGKSTDLRSGAAADDSTTGHVEKTSDRDYEVEERRFRTMESAATRLQKEAKGYLDSLRGSLIRI